MVKTGFVNEKRDDTMALDTSSILETPISTQTFALSSDCTNSSLSYVNRISRTVTVDKDNSTVIIVCYCATHCNGATRQLFTRISDGTDFIGPEIQYDILDKDNGTGFRHVILFNVMAGSYTYTMSAKTSSTTLLRHVSYGMDVIVINLD